MDEQRLFEELNEIKEILQKMYDLRSYQKKRSDRDTKDRKTYNDNYLPAVIDTLQKFQNGQLEQKSFITCMNISKYLNNVISPHLVGNFLRENFSLPVIRHRQGYGVHNGPALQEFLSKLE